MLGLHARGTELDASFVHRCGQAALATGGAAAIQLAPPSPLTQPAPSMGAGADQLRPPSVEYEAP